jgi:glycosyltransferase involved in cell wall biosynthesis
MLISSRNGELSESQRDEDKESALSISVAMATYNGEKFILEQLNSLAAQTVLPNELVVTDDGSTDSTHEIVEAFAKTAPFKVKIHRNAERLGFANNFLQCASLCAGELVAFCDQDDIWLDRKLELCRAAFIDNQVLLCLHNAKVWTSDESSDRHWPGFKTSSVLDAGTSDPLLVYPGFSMLVRKRLFSIINPSKRPTNIHSMSSTPHPMSHDQWVWFIAAIFGKIACTGETLALYRQHGGNTYGAGPQRGLSRTMRLAMTNLNYASQAALSAECARFLEDAGKTLPSDFQGQAEQAARRFSLRGCWQTMRARLYADNSSAIQRLRLFLQILGSGGYAQDQTKTSMGAKAAIKDLLYGVTGFYQIRPSASP